MKYFAIVLAIAIAYLIGQFSVISYSGDVETFKKPKLYRHLADKVTIHNPALPSPEYVTKNELILEEKNITHNHIHQHDFDKSSIKTEPNSNHSKDSTENKQIIRTVSNESTETSTPSASPDFSRTKKDLITYIKKNVLTFESIGTKVFASNGKVLPGLYTFYSYNAREKHIMLNWLVNYKNNVYKRKVIYSETKVGLNRAVLFLNKDEFPGAPEDNEEFLKMLNVQLIFQFGETEITFDKAQIGNIDFSDKKIKENRLALKTRLETDIKLSDNYNPIFK